MNRTLLGVVVSLVLAWPGLGWGAVTVNSRVLCSATSIGTTPFTKSFANTNVSPLILAVAWSGAQTVTGATYNGVAMTQISAVRDGGHFANVTTFVLPSPSTGTNDLVVTFSANPTNGANCFIISTAGGDTTTGVRTAYTRTQANGTGPTLTVVDSQNEDLVFDAATVFATTITFDGGEDATTTIDNAIGGASPSGGLSTKAATGANTAVGTTDVATYAQSAFAVFPAAVPACRGGIPLLGVGGGC